MAYTTPEYLHGLPQDYDILPGGIPVNRKTGEMGRAANANGYIFMGQIHKIVGGKLVPVYPVPATEHPLIAKLRGVGVDPDRLAAALKP